MATIKIDLDRKLGAVDPKIYGGFIEHLGRCIYGGIFEEGSALSDEHGFRRDVMAALRTLHPSVLRWPGGNFASGYHWLDGVGPVEQRPRRMELAWHTEESNRFGTNEFLRYCELVGAQPHLCVNMGSGTMDEAQAWVEYCNGTGSTYWANLRRQHGHPAPYNVKYWDLGNEMYGDWQIGALSAEDYVKKARQFAKVMKWTDPGIQLISCGMFGWNEWDRVVIEGLAPYVDFHSIHLYTGSPDYYSNVFSVHQAERALRSCQAIIDCVRYQQHIKHDIAIVYDEWNVWFREKTEPDRTPERYTLADALGIATYLNIFIRHCRTLKMANFALLVNASAPVVTSKDGLFLQTSYHPLHLYAEHMQGDALDVYVESKQYDLRPEQEVAHGSHRVADLGPFSLLDAAATYNTQERRVMLSVVNRDQDQAISATVQLVDARAQANIVAYEVNGDHPNVVNSFEQPEAVGVKEYPLNLEEQSFTGQSFTYTFPAHSLTLLQLPDIS